eukprot:1159814-Pelagomonas_calceolata.AAC.5
MIVPHQSATYRASKLSEEPRLISCVRATTCNCMTLPRLSAPYQASELSEEPRLICRARAYILQHARGETRAEEQPRGTCTKTCAYTAQSACCSCS